MLRFICEWVPCRDVGCSSRTDALMRATALLNVCMAHRWPVQVLCIRRGVASFIRLKSKPAAYARATGSRGASSVSTTTTCDLRSWAGCLLHVFKCLLMTLRLYILEDFAARRPATYSQQRILARSRDRRCQHRQCSISGPVNCLAWRSVG